MKKGIGLACIHYGVEVPKGAPGNYFLKWIGGYFETNWSVNPHWVANFSKLPIHPVASGIGSFSINDEWYYHMRFREAMKGVTDLSIAISGLKEKTVLIVMFPMSEVCLSRARRLSMWRGFISEMVITKAVVVLALRVDITM